MFLDFCNRSGQGRVQGLSEQKADEQRHKKCGDVIKA